MKGMDVIDVHLLNCFSINCCCIHTHWIIMVVLLMWKVVSRRQTTASNWVQFSRCAFHFCRRKREEQDTAA